MKKIALNNIKYLIIGILLVFIVSSCGEMDYDIDWKAQDMPATIVVEGGITSDYKYQQIRITKSEEYFINKPLSGISGAVVKVSDGEQEYLFLEADTIPGNYISEKEFAGQTGHKYTLNITTPEKIGEKNTFTATGEVIKGFEITKITAELYKNPYPDEDSSMTFVFIEGNEPKEIENYYYIRIIKNGEAFKDTINLYNLANEDYLFGDDKNMMGIGLIEVFPNDTLDVEVYSISKDYYRFIEGVMQISNLADPMGMNGPPANAVGNINNGEGLGFFVTSFVSRGTAIVQDMRDPEEKE